MATVFFDGSTDGVLTTDANWSTGAVPVTNADVVIDGNMFPSTVTALTSPTQPAIVATISSLTILNTSVSFGTAAAPLEINVGGSGSKKVHDAGTGAKYLTIANWVEWVILGGSTMGIAGLTNAGNVLKINASTATITFGTLEADSLILQAGTVHAGRYWWENGGSAAPDLTMYGGTLDVDSPLAAALVYGGILTHREGAITALTVKNAQARLLSTGTVTTLTLQPGGKADFSYDMRAKTVTNCTMDDSSTFYDPYGIAVLTNGIVATDTSKITLNVGRTRTISVT
jgi:hypothetical protein